MSDAGGDNETDSPVSNITFTLDDQAANPLPADTVIANGASYRPLDDVDTGELVPNDTFPPPAPPLTPGAVALSTFNGAAPNGTWSLYVVDDYPGGPEDGGDSPTELQLRLEHQHRRGRGGHDL